MIPNINGRHKIVPASYLMLIKNNQVLLARRMNTGHEDGNYSMPAGHIEPGESATSTLIREAKEEAGVTIKPEDVRMAHVMCRKGSGSENERVDFFFSAEKYVGIPKIMEPEKCDDMRWFPIDDLPENTIGYIKQAIDCSRKVIVYSEFGWDEK